MAFGWLLRARIGRGLADACRVEVAPRCGWSEDGALRDPWRGGQMPLIMNLENVSRYLVEFQRQRLEDLEVPGQYLQARDAQDYKDLVRIDRFHPVVHTVRKVPRRPHGALWAGALWAGRALWPARQSGTDHHAPAPRTPHAPVSAAARHVVPAFDNARQQRAHVSVHCAALKLAPCAC